MERFLKAVAKGYMEHYADLSRFTFVMPNKRSGSFLLKYLKDESTSPRLSPRIVSISEFVADNVDEVAGSRIDLIFRLYLSYMEVGHAGEDMTFEKFLKWGETILNDFVEVDMQLIDADEIYQNIYDFNAIRSDFLTEEQKEVMVEYFGYSPSILDRKSNRLWQKEGEGAPEESKQSDARKRFVTLWQILGPLYHKFKENLEKAGLTTAGGAYRSLAEKVEEGFSPYGDDKLVFVGFNALSGAERKIFKTLKKAVTDIGEGVEPKADFVWDMVSPFFAASEDPAVRFVAINSREDHLPSPDWLEPYLERTVPVKAPEVEIISVPSNVMQVKVASRKLREIAKSVSEEDIRDAKIAVVLPDENLLLPMLFSLPEEYPNPNLTMGFPLRQTPVISFAALLRKLQTRAKKSGEKTYFFFEDIKDILSHPYGAVLFAGVKVSDFIKNLSERKYIVVEKSELAPLGENADLLFRLPGGEGDWKAALDYITDIFVHVIMGLRGGAKANMRGEIEVTYINVYLDALRRLRECLEQYDLPISSGGVFSLADRMIAGETVAFEGEPLEGLQIMGVLETRCLDFDRIIMLSLNERIMPKVGRNSTFIPYSIRVAYGMPPANYQEDIFAYYFFRALGRAQEAVLTYDSRSADTRNPGASRYLLQMKYLPGEVKLKETETQFGMPLQSRHDFEIAKDAAVMEYLGRFIGEAPKPEDRQRKEAQKEADSGQRKEAIKGKNFSASGLNHYFHCPVRFLFCDVLGLYIEREPIESIDAIDLGTIVHDAMMRLYIPQKEEQGKLLARPKVMTAQNLRALLNQRNARGETRVEEEARKAILGVHFHLKEHEWDEGQLRGSAAILHRYIADYIRNVIEADIEHAPFRLWGCEIKELMEHTLPDGRKVRLKMVIDRLDQEGPAGAEGAIRVVDYKTGSPRLEAEGFDNIFDGSHQTQYIFQLLFYSELLVKLLKKNEASDKKEKTVPEEFGDLATLPERLKLVIYAVPRLPADGELKPKVAGLKVETLGQFHAELEEDGKTFLSVLDDKIMEILDPEVPFSGQPTEERCRGCEYKLRCELRSH